MRRNLRQAGANIEKILPYQYEHLRRDRFHAILRHPPAPEPAPGLSRGHPRSSIVIPATVPGSPFLTIDIPDSVEDPLSKKMHVNKIFRHIFPQKNVLYIDGALPCPRYGRVPGKKTTNGKQTHSL